MRRRRGKQQVLKIRKLCLLRASLEHWGGTSIPPTSAKLPTRRLCCQSRCKTRIIYQRLLLGCRRRTRNLKFPRQLHGAKRGCSLPLAGGITNLLGPVGPKAGETTGTYSTHSSSTTLMICTSGFVAVSLQGLPPWYLWLLVLFVLQRCKTSPYQQARRSLTTWPLHAVLTRLQGAYKKFDVMLLARATDSESIVKSDSEKKLLGVKCGLRAIYCAQNRTPRFSPSLMASRSRFKTNLTLRVSGPRITSVVNWNTWNITFFRSIRKPTQASAIQNTWLDTIHSLNRCCWAREPPCAGQIDRTSLTSGRLPQLPLFLHEGLTPSPARFNFAPSRPLLL